MISTLKVFCINKYALNIIEYIYWFTAYTVCFRESGIQFKIMMSTVLY